MTCRRKPVGKKNSFASLEASITGYYDSLTDAEVEEDRLWSEFAGRELAAIVRNAYSAGLGIRSS